MSNLFILLLLIKFQFNICGYLFILLLMNFIFYVEFFICFHMCLTFSFNLILLLCLELIFFWVFGLISIFTLTFFFWVCLLGWNFYYFNNFADVIRNYNNDCPSSLIELPGLPLLTASRDLPSLFACFQSLHLCSPNVSSPPWSAWKREQSKNSSEYFWCTRAWGLEGDWKV